MNEVIKYLSTAPKSKGICDFALTKIQIVGRLGKQFRKAEFRKAEVTGHASQLTAVPLKTARHLSRDLIKI